MLGPPSPLNFIDISRTCALEYALDMEKLLIVVDYQVDFVVGALGFKGAELLEPHIVSLIHSFEDSGDDVVFTKDIHEDNYLHEEEGRNLPIPHCLRGTPGSEFYGQIAELAKKHPVFEKPTFGSAELLKYIQKKNYRKIALCGLDGSICVFANAIVAKTANPDAHIEVYADATGSGDPEALETAYRAMRRLHIDVLRGPEKVGGIF
jgi:nicotinamidase/pyrazinamidase